MTLKINKDEMLAFYENLDVIEFKYGRNLSDEQYSELEEAEDVYQFAEFTKKSYGDVLESLNMVYADKDIAAETLKIYDMVYQKIICQYLNINGMERLLNEKYIEFEWVMHLGIDHKRHSMRYYRDHFLHQIRDAYMMHIFLEELGVIEKVREVLENRANSKVSRFVYKHVQQQINQKPEWLPERFYEEYHNPDFYYRNIIHMASYMAGLFHDIGYPESDNAFNQKKIGEYIANLYLAETSGYPYGKLSALLQNSLLFRVVSFHEIKERLEIERPDHGTVSAITFLIHFYENGAIYQLEPYKKCAVELAALAIYNHTNKYCYKGNKRKEASQSDYYRISFRLNPISYLLRLCDDLQEWDRIYFEISNCSNLIICNKCNTPIVRKNADDQVIYQCNCQSESGFEESAFERLFSCERNFRYRRIYNVVVCNNLLINKKDDKIIFDLQYDLDRLLHMAYINCGYANYRMDELADLKYLMDFQQELPQLYLKYFVTYNPILIKTKILNEYVNGCCKNLECAGLLEKHAEISPYQDISDGMVERKYLDFQQEFADTKKIWKEKLLDLILDFPPDFIKQQVEYCLELYIELCLFMKIYENVNQKSLGDKLLRVYIDEWKRGIPFIGNGELGELVEDCFRQFETMYEDISAFSGFPDKYYKQLKPDNFTFKCSQRFTAASNYVPIVKHKKTGKEYIDAYTDLKMIQKMLYCISIEAEKVKKLKNK